jgi:hypothetical protein
MLTAQDFEDYGDAFLDVTRRAAVEAVGPALQQLRQENQNLRQMAARAQNSEIQRTLDQSVPGWRETYQNPAFSQWLSEVDGYSGAIRSQLLRHAVSNGDAGRVAAIYRGFQQEASGHRAPGQQRASQSRPTATGGKPIYTRQQIAAFYEARRKGEINDANWRGRRPRSWRLPIKAGSLALSTSTATN